MVVRDRGETGISRRNPNSRSQIVRHRRLHGGVHDVEHDDGRKDELQIGVGNDEADLAVNLPRNRD
jgi:hypothetical protein